MAAREWETAALSAAYEQWRNQKHICGSDNYKVQCSAAHGRRVRLLDFIQQFEENVLRLQALFRSNKIGIFIHKIVIHFRYYSRSNINKNCTSD